MLLPCGGRVSGGFANASSRLAGREGEGVRHTLHPVGTMSRFLVKLSMLARSAVSLGWSAGLTYSKNCLWRGGATSGGASHVNEVQINPMLNFGLFYGTVVDAQTLPVSLAVCLLPVPSIWRGHRRLLSRRGELSSRQSPDPQGYCDSGERRSPGRDKQESQRLGGLRDDADQLNPSAGARALRGRSERSLRWVQKRIYWRVDSPTLNRQVWKHMGCSRKLQLGHTVLP